MACYKWKTCIDKTELPVLLISEAENIFVFVEIRYLLALIILSLQADNTENPKIQSS
jgi:hypothetical protein